MAQGAIKKRSRSSLLSSSTKRSQSVGLKKGRRTIAPKKSALVKAKGITKKHSAGLTAKTEKNLAQRVGHLELLPGGKRTGGEKDKETGKRRQ